MKEGTDDALTGKIVKGERGRKAKKSAKEREEKKDTALTILTVVSTAVLSQKQLKMADLSRSEQKKSHFRKRDEDGRSKKLQGFVFIGHGFPRGSWKGDK